MMMVLEHVVVYTTHDQALGKMERKCSVTRKELLAVVSFMHYFQPSLLAGEMIQVEDRP